LHKLCRRLPPTTARQRAEEADAVARVTIATMSPEGG
jgi:hypothetical protein